MLQFIYRVRTYQRFPPRNHCLKNGDEPVCENESTCTNLLNGYSCACVAGEHWAGKSCAEYSYFSVSVGQQVVFETEFTELSVSLLKDTPAWHSVLLLFYAVSCVRPGKPEGLKRYLK